MCIYVLPSIYLVFLFCPFYIFEQQPRDVKNAASESVVFRIYATCTAAPDLIRSLEKRNHKTPHSLSTVVVA